MSDFPHGRAARPAFLTIPLSWLYGAISTRMQAGFDPQRAYRAGVPVISVGNLSVGGTGKTPTVIALARLLIEMDSTLAEPGAMAVLSRGYGRTSKELVVVRDDDDYRRSGDEPLLIKRTLKSVEVVVHAKRAWCARYAVERLGARLLILDDGFQHQALGRDLNLVLVDGLEPLGNGYALPAGPLRENPESLRRASALVGVGDDVSGAAALAARFGKPLIQVRRRMVLPVELSTKMSTPLYVLTSIARPKRFLKGLRDKGLLIAGGQAFRDHHRFSAKELQTVATHAKAVGAKAIVTTEKDRIRMGIWDAGLPLLTIGLEMEFSDAESVKTLIKSAIG